MQKFLLGLPLLLLPALAAAQDQSPRPGAALVVGNADYETLRDVPNAARIAGAAAPLGPRGFELFGGTDLSSDALLQQAEAFTLEMEDVDRRLVVLAGQFVTDERLSWFAATEAPQPGPVTLTRVGLPVEPLLGALGRLDGPTVVLLGVNPNQIDYAPGIRAGVGSFDLPEGVTLITGQVWTIERLLDRMDENPDQDPAALAGNMPMLTVQTARDEADEPAAQPEPAPPAAPAPPSTRDERPLPADMSALDEPSTWAAARAADTEEGYARYLDRFPGGANVDQAVSRLAELRARPSDPNAAAETALGLDLQARQRIQRDLTVLGYDTRGIDGIFGSGTRGAISSWQDRSGLSATGYLTAEQVPTLRAQAQARSVELEAEAAQRRAEQERADRALWQATAEANTQAAYRDYLDRFPDGLQADAAREAIRTIREDRQRQASAQDRAAWEEARSSDTQAAYRRYLDREGDGQFDEEARTRLTALTEAATPSPAAQREAALGMDPITLQLVESRLKAEGLNPGAVDGQLDDTSRRAIRRYQRDRGLNVTGYLDQRTVSQMLIDAVR